ncbi:transposase [Amycolatopsis sp. NPDC051106]|uniref:transposase n=1 Tax=unclassified Amycolatopsis TaxID=2618356 RepID=UPI00343B4D45
MAKKKPRARQRPRRVFTTEFKAQIVDLVQRGERTVPEVVRDFELTDSVVRKWIAQAERDAGTRTDGLTSDEKAELAALRRENKRLQEDVEILRRATAFFAQETR